MKKLLVFLFIFSSSYVLKAQTQCMYFYSITPGLVPETSTSYPLAKFTWDTSEAVYSSNTTTKIQIIKSTNCDFIESGPIQNYAIGNFFNPATGTMTIDFNTIGSRCFKWRLVNQGTNANGANCLTATPWQNYNIQNYY